MARKIVKLKIAFNYVKKRQTSLTYDLVNPIPYEGRFFHLDHEQLECIYNILKIWPVVYNNGESGMEARDCLSKMTEYSNSVIWNFPAFTVATKNHENKNVLEFFDYFKYKNDVRGKILDKKYNI